MRCVRARKKEGGETYSGERQTEKGEKGGEGARERPAREQREKENEMA